MNKFATIATTALICAGYTAFFLLLMPTHGVPAIIGGLLGGR